MHRMLNRLLLIAVLGLCGVLVPARAAASGSPHLVDVSWLQQHLGRGDVLLLDASPAPMHAAGHIPGAVHADLFSFGANEPAPAEMERRLQAWGIDPGRRIVLYDNDGSMWAARLFFDLYHLGFPADKLALLDGGLAKWRQLGGAVTKDPTPAPARGGFRIVERRDEVRVRLPEFISASGDPARNAVIDALEPSYYFGGAKFFDRAGHVPNAINLPREDLLEADKTFKSADEIRRMAGVLGIRPEQRIHTYCGGGVAAAVPFFALKFIAGYPDVRLYRESQLEWMRDERGLPVWTYAAPNLARDAQWLSSWGGAMLRAFGLSRVSVVDVRPAAAYLQGHVPFALNIPAETFARYIGEPDRLAGVLGAAGVDPAHEAVVVSDGGLNPASALAFAMLDRLGQSRTSILLQSVDEWGLRGFALVKEPTVVGARQTPKDLVVPAVAYRSTTGATTRPAPAATGAAPLHPKVYVAAGPQPPARAPAGTVLHIPYTELLNADGTPKAAKDLWAIFSKAGLSRYAEVVSIADEPGHAAVAYVVLRMMGFPDVSVALR